MFFMTMTQEESGGCAMSIGQGVGFFMAYVYGFQPAERIVWDFETVIGFIMSFLFGLVFFAGGFRERYPD